MDLTNGDITLRAPTESDASLVCEAVRSSLAELSRWMPWATEDYDETTALRWIRREFDPSEHGFLIIDGFGRMAGACGLNQVNQLNKSANLGYWLRTDCTGKGWATEATQLLAAYGIEELGFHRLEIIMSVENEDSRRVAERAGAHFEGMLRGALLLGGRHHDAHCFSIIGTDLR